MKRNENCVGCHEKTIRIIHKGVYKETKICLTCNITKPFRSHHCSDCDNCVIRFDHHCPWFGGCVGIRNYIYFFIFLIILNIKDIYVTVFCILHIIYIYKDITNEEKEIKNWVAINLIQLIPSLLTLIFLGCIMLFTVGLLIYHIKLVINNMTTKEEIKKLIFENIGNPYDEGISKNCKNFWTRHKTMANNFTVKELRQKIKMPKIQNNVNNIKHKNNSKEKQKIIPLAYSKKEQQLKNKKKKINNNINKEDNLNNKKNEEIERESYTVSINTEKSGNSAIKNNNQIFNKIKIKTKNNIKGIDNNDKEINIYKKNNKNSKNKKIKSNTDYKKQKEIEYEFSEEEENISDENDNTKTKICNTFIKNKSNLNSNYQRKINKKEKENIFNGKNIFLTQNEKGYKIAQKRLEELSSEIIINQELKDSISIPKENSFSSDLSES